MTPPNHRDPLAAIMGGFRLASGVSFLVSPRLASRLWGADADNNPTTLLLLGSMGYRDALVGAMLLRSGLRGDDHLAGWFLASVGADLSDLVGGIAHHGRMSARMRAGALGGAVVGVGLGLLGAARSTARTPR